MNALIKLIPNLNGRFFFFLGEKIRCSWLLSPMFNYFHAIKSFERWYLVSCWYMC